MNVNSASLPNLKMALMLISESPEHLMLIFGFAALFLHLAWRFGRGKVSRIFFTLLILTATLLFILMPNFSRARKPSARARMLEDLRLLDAAIDQYAIEHRASNPGQGSSPLSSPLISGSLNYPITEWAEPLRESTSPPAPQEGGSH